VVFATGERDTSVSALFSESASCVVMDAAFRLLVGVGFTYSLVNPLLLLTGHGVVVSSRRVGGCGSSSFQYSVFSNVCAR
jgi:hypothetical protein